MPAATPNTEIRQFREDLRARTSGMTRGTDDDQYSEGGFLQVKALIDRLRVREGTTDQDRAWRRRVTDVRQWFVFSASERWREGDVEHENYLTLGQVRRPEKFALRSFAAPSRTSSALGDGGSDPPAMTDRSDSSSSTRRSGVARRPTRYAPAVHRARLQLLIVTPLQKLHRDRAARGVRRLRRQRQRRPFATATHHRRGAAAPRRSEHRASLAEPAAGGAPAAGSPDGLDGEPTASRSSSADGWSRPEDMVAKLRDRWDRGTYLGPVRTHHRGSRCGPPVGPTATDLLERRESVAWIDGVRAWPLAVGRVRGAGSRTGQLRSRSLGDNDVPGFVVVDSIEELAMLVGRPGQIATFDRLLALTAERRPELVSWVSAHPMDVPESWLTGCRCSTSSTGSTAPTPRRSTRASSTCPALTRSSWNGTAGCSAGCSSRCCPERVDTSASRFDARFRLPGPS